MRLDLCAATATAVSDNRHGVVPALIPGGRHAVLRHGGPDTGLTSAANWLCRTWLLHSRKTRREGPLILQRLAIVPDVPEHEAISDLLLPLQ